MAKLIKCECGYVARGETDDDVVDQAERHIAADHPALAGQVSREEMLGWIEQV
jgi:predicted small metal-binding protein